MAVKENLVDLVWGQDRPARPSDPIRVLGDEFTGKKFQEKLQDLRKELEKKKSAGFVVCTFARPQEPSRRVRSVRPLTSSSCTGMLDEIAWLFNLRGNE